MCKIKGKMASLVCPLLPALGKRASPRIMRVREVTLALSNPATAHRTDSAPSLDFPIELALLLEIHFNES